MPIAELPLESAQGEAQAPSPRIPTNTYDHSVILAAKDFGDLFSLKRVVKLEADADALLGYVHKILYYKDTIIVLDTTQKRVQVFDDQGSFLHTIGRLGEGPGEYREPASIYVVDDRVAVVDRQGTRVLMYTLGGRLLQTIIPDQSDFPIFLYEHMIFHDDFIYVCEFFSHQQNMPKHVVLDTSTHPAKPVFGFGDRLSFYYTSIGRKTPFLITSIFEEVNGTIWTVPGYETDIQVFDFNGHLLGVLPSGVDGMTADEVSSIKSRRDYIQISSLPKPDFLFHDQKLAFQVFVGLRTVNIYDVNGNLIRKQLPMKTIPTATARALENGYLLSLIGVTSSEPNTLRTDFGETLFSAFLEAGFDVDDFTTDNPYVILSRPRY